MSFKNNNNVWYIQDSFKYPTKQIALIESVDQVGIYVEEVNQKEIYVNFKLELEIENNRDLIDTNLTDVELTSYQKIQKCIHLKVSSYQELTFLLLI